jgi:hypothetical protein
MVYGRGASARDCPGVRARRRAPMHHPSTVIHAGGRFYRYATGRGLRRSCWTTDGRGAALLGDGCGAWRRARIRGDRAGRQQYVGSGIVHVGDKYFLPYAHRARSRRPPSALGRSDARSRVAGLPVGRRRSERLVGWRRGVLRTDIKRSSSRSKSLNAYAWCAAQWFSVVDTLAFQACSFASTNTSLFIASRLIGGSRSIRVAKFAERIHGK